MVDKLQKGTSTKVLKPSNDFTYRLGRQESRRSSSIAYTVLHRDGDGFIGRRSCSKAVSYNIFLQVLPWQGSAVVGPRIMFLDKW